MLTSPNIPAATKIVATLGPAWHSPERMRALLEAGVDVARINFSHGEAAEHVRHAQQLREVAGELRCNLAILADLQGAKIRIGAVQGGSVELENGQALVLDTAFSGEGDAQRVGVDYAGLTQDVQAGDVLLLNDGLLQLQVTDVTATEVVTTVLEGGTLASRKGVNKRGGGLSLDALTDKDDADIASALELGADFIAVSFVQSAADMEQARAMVRRHAKALDMPLMAYPELIAKIERVEAIENLDEILAASEGIMVARGDLAVETGFAAVPALQKQMIARANALGKLVITATQMMESMVHSAAPTRAEVSDVANAVLDGTGAVMLSAETAVGEYPVQVVEQMNRICLAAEQAHSALVGVGCAAELHGVVGGVVHGTTEGEKFVRMDQTVANGAIQMARQAGAKAIVALTESGATPRFLGRYRADSAAYIPIVALTANPHTLRTMALYRNVQAMRVDLSLEADAALRKIDQLLHLRVGLQVGDVYAITYGQPMGQPGGTNTVKLCTVRHV